VSAESGVPTFRGSGGLWRTYNAQELASYYTFTQDPALVWEFYHYRRVVLATKLPNAAHIAIASAQSFLRGLGREMTVMTQNVDELHHKAGTEDVLSLHGSLWKTKCLKCRDVKANYDNPICEALRGKGAPDPSTPASHIRERDLPRCEECGGLLRPGVVLFGETLDEKVLRACYEAIDACDLVVIAGTSSVVHPAAMLAPRAAARGVPVAEFNLEQTPSTEGFGFHFEGPCGETLPLALSPFPVPKGEQ